MLGESVHKHMERSGLGLDGTCPHVADHGMKAVGVPRGVKDRYVKGTPA